MPSNEIFLHLGRLEGKMDALLAHVAQTTAHLDEHNVRIEQLEQHRAWFLGASAVVASLVAAAIGFLKGGH